VRLAAALDAEVNRPVKLKVCASDEPVRHPQGDRMRMLFAALHGSEHGTECASVGAAPNHGSSLETTVQGEL